jgi:hypothetical protein
MSEDPIVAEVRQARRELQEEAGHDFKTFFEQLRKAGGKYTNRVVDSVPRPEEISPRLQTASG